MGLRIRTLKPEILTDEKSAALSDTEWRLFVSCIVMSDDYGNFRASPAFLHSQAFWAASTSRDACAKAIETLARLSLVTLYTVCGQTYGHVSGWSKHQRVDHPGKPSCPLPEHDKSSGCEKSSRESRESVRNISDTLPTDHDQDQDQEGKGNAPTDSGKTFLPTTPSRLKSCLDAAMQKRRPDRCPYSPGQWWDREAGQLLRDLGDPVAVAPEILRRIGLFVADDRMAPWTVKRFCAEYNGIGVARPAPFQQPQRPQAKY